MKKLKWSLLPLLLPAALAQADYKVDVRHCSPITIEEPGDAIFVRWDGGCTLSRPLERISHPTHSSRDYWVGSYARTQVVQTEFLEKLIDSCSGWTIAYTGRNRLGPERKQERQFSLYNNVPTNGYSFEQLPMTQEEALKALDDAKARCEVASQ